jgi:Ulp1 family protease
MITLTSHCHHYPLDFSGGSDDVRDRVTITNKDKARLYEGELLNDTIINFFLKFMMVERYPTLIKRVHLYSSFFYTRLVDGENNAKLAAQLGNSGGPSCAQQSYENVARWTSGVDIFDKEVLVVPINQGLHWSLALIVNPGAIKTHQEWEEKHKRRGAVADGGNNVDEEDEEGESQQMREAMRRSLEGGGGGGGGVGRDLGFVGVGGSGFMIGAGDDQKRAVAVEAVEEEDGHTWGGGQTLGGGKSESNGYSPDGVCGKRQWEQQSKQYGGTDIRQYGSGAGGKSGARSNTGSSVGVTQEEAELQRVIELSKQEQDGASASAQSHPAAHEVVSLDSDGDEEAAAAAPEGVSPPQPCIVFLDSLGCHNKRKVQKLLRDYLQQEWERKCQQVHGECKFDAKSIANVKPLVPMQKNSCDCGVFVLMYAEHFLSALLGKSGGPSGALTSADVKDKMCSYLNKEIFKLHDISTKRQEITDIITELQNKANEQGAEVIE